MVHRTAAGRGAWLCSGECLETAIRRRAFDKAWRRTVSGADLAALRIAFNGVITEVEESPDDRTPSSGRGR